MTSKYSFWMLSKTRLYFAAVRHNEQPFEIAADLLGEAAPMTIGDVLTDLVVENAVSLRSFFDEPQRMDRVDAKDTVSGVYAFAKVIHVHISQLVHDGHPCLWWSGSRAAFCTLELELIAAALRFARIPCSSCPR